MGDTDWIVTAVLALCVLGTVVFPISDNRRSQATLAWALAFVFTPGVGALVYILFGRSRKAFSKRGELLRQDLEANARPLLSPLLSRQDAEIERLERKSVGHKRLMMLVRQNSQSALTVVIPAGDSSSPPTSSATPLTPTPSTWRVAR